MESEFEAIFARLRRILQKQTGSLTVAGGHTRALLPRRSRWSGDTEGMGWQEKEPNYTRRMSQAGKTYASYHLIGLDGNTRLRDAMSFALKGRMQGRTCFNFQIPDEALFEELEQITAQSIAGFRKAGYISDMHPPSLS